MQKTNLDKIMILGGNGMVGSSLRRVGAEDPSNFDLISVTRSEVDLLDQKATMKFIDSQKPDCMIIAAAKVGGIGANSYYPKDFIYENLAIQLNAIEGAYRAGVQRIIFLGSSCIYPRECQQPMKEEYLLTGRLEPTNEAYAIAKIAGITMCSAYNKQVGMDFRSVMPCNLYGLGDMYSTRNSHVIPSLIAKMHEAKLRGLAHVDAWGSGRPKREFLYVDDLSRAIFALMKLSKEEWDLLVGPDCSHINVGAGVELTIAEIAQKIKEVVKFPGEIVFDTSKPDGVFGKLLDSRRIESIGWRSQITIEQGLCLAYRDFCERQ